MTSADERPGKSPGRGLAASKASARLTQYAEVASVSASWITRCWKCSTLAINAANASGVNGDRPSGSVEGSSQPPPERLDQLLVLGRTVVLVHKGQVRDSRRL